VPAVAVAAAKRKGKGKQKPSAAPGPAAQQQPPDIEAVPEAKQALLDACSKANYKSGIFTPPDEKKEIEEAARALERLNSATTIANIGSRMLNGEWKLLYSTSESISAGLWGPLVGEVTQTMEAGQRNLVCSTEFFGGALKMEWRTSWSAVGNQEITLPGEDWYPYLFGIRLSLWSFSNDEGVSYKMTYTDSGLRIFRQDKFEKRAGEFVSSLFVFTK